ncbi:hypothetical protein Ae505Ps2_0736 [Pseudonocardia sp. Ae505_Ps2]|nr:hypothetical protein Ae505Ps2_0736 [Pseudonocardia sp. Ae505_Ps2]
MLWPNAETPCSRPPSPRCGESRYVPGAPARSPQLRSYYSTPSTTARHDQPATENTSVDVDALSESVASLSIAYLHQPAEPMLRKATDIRKESLRRLTEGAVRPHELRDLTLAAGRASGVLIYAALDLGHPEIAATHARAAWHLAESANDNELRAWVRGTESLLARFEKNYTLADNLAQDGLKYAGAGTSTIRLLCGAAQCAANLNNSRKAQDLLDQALSLRDKAASDSVNGLYSFSYAKQLYYGGSSLMWLDDPQALKRADRDAGRAISLWEHEGDEFRSLDDEALAHVYQATARVKVGEIDGAMQVLRPVINLPEERKISWIRRRISEMGDLLDGKQFKGSVIAADARDELRSLT